MQIQGYIKDCKDGIISIVAPFDRPHIIKKQEIYTVGVTLEDSRYINLDQRKKIYATFRDISEYTGHLPEEIKELMKYDYIAHTGRNYFSLSNCTMSTATEFLEHLIEFCLIWDIPTADNLIERAPDIAKYIYLCLVNKKCCITGEKAELHHVDAVGMGRNRKEIIHLGMHVLPLTRKMHTIAHSMGNKDFQEKYKVFGIKLDKQLCQIWKLKHE